MTATKLGKLLNPNDVGYDVIPILGQSNASGRGSGYDTTRIDTPSTLVDLYATAGTYAGQILRAIEPSSPYAADGGLTTGAAVAMGFATSFARWYSHSIPGNRRVLLVNCAYGGTGFSTPDFYSTALTWLPGTTDGNNLFERAIASITAALAAAGPNARIPAVLWHQGEQDAANGRTQTQYAGNLDTLISTLRTRLNLPNVPFVLGPMTPEAQAQNSAYAGVAAAHIDTPRRNLRTAQAVTPGSGYTDPSFGILHWSAPGQRLLGRAYFDALAVARANVLGVAPIAPVPTLTQSGTSILVTWKRPIGRATDFNVQYSTNGGGTWTALARAQSIDTSATITGVTLGATISVQVRTVNEQGVAAWSASTTLTLASIPAQVTGLTAGAATSTTQPLTWSAVTSATSYIVQRSTDGTTWTTAATVTSASATVTGLTASTAYQYRVTASNAAGNGTPSATVSATTLAPAVPTAGTIAVYDAANITGVANNAAITTWPEPNSLPMTAFNSPTFIAAGVNGQPYVSFNGTNQYTENTSLVSPKVGTEIIVGRLRSSGTFGLYNSAASGSARTVYSSGGIWATYNGSALASSKAVVANEWVIIVVNYSDTSGAAQIRVNRITNTGTLGTLVHGGVRFASTEGASQTFAPADIAYARFYNRTLSAQEILDAEASLGARFGITVP